MPSMTARGKKRKPMDTQVVVRMSRGLRNTLRELAEEERRPVGNLVRVLLEEALEARRKGR